MGSDDRHSVDVSNPLLGSLKVSGANVNTLFTIAGFILICILSVVLFTHQTEAKDNNKALAQVLKEANQEVAQALKDSNKEVAQALKDSNAAVTDAIKQMAIEQRRANEIGREQTCLLTLPPDRRTNAGDFCKRLSRERDR